MSKDKERIWSILNKFKESGGRLTVLTGAGVSAQSGIPTFRGEEGYWTIGSVNYKPTEIGTHRLFSKYPNESWEWYLLRRKICANANPNQGHYALAELESHIGNQFRLITQNVDGLHLRAGNSLENTYQVHGNIHQMRCFKECSYEVFSIPEEIPVDREGPLTKDEKDHLVCPKCGAITRPHLLWWDEYYTEYYYQIDTARSCASNTELLIVAGTSAAANITGQVVRAVRRKKGSIIDINPEYNPLSKLAESADGVWYPATSAEILPQITDFLKN